MAKRYYLAYGSNLNLEQMMARCPTAKPVGIAYLEDWRLAFKGSKTGAYLTIDPWPGARTPVGVWEVQDADVKSLDRYEGYPEFYDRTEGEITYISFHSGKPKTVTAFVYRMPDGRKIGLPTYRYMNTCLIGYADFGFNRKALIDAYYRCEEVVRLEA